MKRRARSGFTLLELLVVVSIIAVVAAMLLPALSQARQKACLARCTTNLRQIGLALRMYMDDSGGRFIPYSHDADGGTYWYFGFETSASLSMPEGQRQIDVTKAKLYPYFHSVGGIELCPSFRYDSLTYKPKYKGASYGYGLNLVINGKPESSWNHKAAGIVAFADCAQINTWQAPASPTNPLVEEWYYVTYNWKSVQFRHTGRANVLFCDGHVEALPMASGTLETQIPQANIGRLNASVADKSMFQ